MQDLTLVGVDDDGEHLVLAALDGRRFRLRADDALRLAARRGASAPQDAGGPPAPLAPREIQARLRAGEDAAEIAAATGTGEERVRRYEGPVLAERAHVASQARALPVRWRDGSGRSPALEDLVADRLAGRGVDGSPVWDAWRREDGAWLVQAVFRAGARERRATWSLDLQRAHLEALDDEARWLSSVDVAEDAAPPEGLRLAAVREEVYDVDEPDAAATARRGDRDPRRDDRERDGQGRDGQGRDEQERADPDDLARRRDAREEGGAARRRGGEPAPQDEAGTGDRDAAREEADRRERAGRTLDLLEHLRGRRGRRQPLADPDDDELEALTWAELQALTAGGGPSVDEDPGDAEAVGEDPWDSAGDPPAAHPPASRPEEALDDGVLALGPPGAPAAGRADADPPPAGAEDASDAGAGAAAPGRGGDRDEADEEPATRSRRRRRRGAARGGEDDGVPGQEELLPEPPRAGDGDGPAAGDERAAASDDPPGASDEEARRRPPRRGARPSVPSWDDIVFGQRRD